MGKLKVVLLLSLAFLFSGQTNAQIVSVGDAKAKALEFFSNGAKKLPAKNGAKRQAPAVSNVELAYTSQKDGKTCFYVFNNGTDGGFVIVGGDEAAKEILAYIPQGHFDYDKAPDNLKWWLKHCQKQIMSASNHHSKMQNQMGTNINSESKTGNYNDIPDMITTKWNQGTPFNNSIPPIEGITPPTGCTATAVAQVMNYWKYPEKGDGIKTNYIGEQVSVDLSSVNYDWDNMIDSYNEDYNETQSKAVSELMYHVGMALNSIYTKDWTGVRTLITYSCGIHNSAISHALVENFNYDPNIKGLCTENYSTEELKNIIYDELTAGRPVLYGGTNTEGGKQAGHSWICHGYSSELDMFSMNWGWGGLSDGYYSLHGISEQGSEMFLDSEDDVATVYIHIQPKNRPNSPEVNVGDKISVGGYLYNITSTSQKTVEITHGDIGEHVYRGDITIPSTITYNGEIYTVNRIGTCAFAIPDSKSEIFKYSEAVYHMEYNDEITSITIPNSVKSLAIHAIAKCHNITSLTIPNSVTTIRLGAFFGCINLTTINLPNTINTIKPYTFYGCWYLNMTIPKHITKIEPWAFSSCLYMDKISVESGNPVYDSRNNCNAIIETATNELIVGCRSTIIPNTVTRIGHAAFEECYGLKSIIIPNSVTSIGPSAFQGCYNLEEISIPNSVKTIEIWAFSACPLSSIVLGNSITSINNYAFENCSKLTNILSKSLVPPTIDGDFVGISNSVTVYVPLESVTAYQSATGWNCLNIAARETVKVETITLDKTSEFIKIGDTLQLTATIKPIIAYNTTLSWFSSDTTIAKVDATGLVSTIKAGTATITAKSTDGSEVSASCEVKVTDNLLLDHGTCGENVIWTFDEAGNLNIVGSGSMREYPYSSDVPWNIHNKDIKYANIAEGVSNIGGCAFYDCSSLTEVIIPNSVTTIGNSAFYGCSSLTKITIPDSVTTIGNYTFSNCSNISTISLPKALTTIGDVAFGNCSSLTKITIPDSVTTIGNGAFSGCSSLTKITIPDSVTTIGNYTFSNCSNISTISLPKALTTIGNGAFWDCSSLTEVIIPNLVTTIGEWAFYGCSSLTEVIIPDSVTTIGFGAFNGCSNLKSLTIGSNCSSIGNLAFWECDKLISVTNFSTTPQEIDDNVFRNYGTLHVLPGCGEDYRNAENWKNFTIVEDAGVNTGDVNGDGVIDIADVNCIINVILENAPASNFNGRADVNGDGTIDIADINTIIKTMLEQ